MSAGFVWLTYYDFEDYLYSKVHSKDIQGMLAELEEHTDASTVAAVAEYKDFLTEVEGLQEKMSTLNQVLQRIIPTIRGKLKIY